MGEASSETNPEEAAVETVRCRNGLGNRLGRVIGFRSVDGEQNKMLYLMAITSVLRGTGNEVLMGGYSSMADGQWLW